MPRADRVRPGLRRAARFGLVLYMVGVFLITWLPGDQADKVTGIVAKIARVLNARWDVPLSTGYPALEFLANVALFVPVGILLALSWPRLRFWQVTLIGLATTTLIELVQTGLPTRFPALSDVIANTGGTAIGWILAAVVHAAVSPRPAPRSA